MCGIAGLVHKTGRPVTEPEIGRLTDLVAHRGPDGRGVMIEGNIGLGHRRLSIIDLSEDGRQPMNSERAGLSIVYNGEIYNYIELRSELADLGYDFRTCSDTEVILAAYELWGEACVTRFNGMWALAILDRRRNRIFLSRDRFGVKPLHYSDDAHSFVFGSEIGQIVSLMQKRTTDPARVSAFLLTGGLDLDDGTFFEGVSKLPAGCNGIFDLGVCRLTVTRYYDLQQRNDYHGIEASEAASLYRQLFRDSVRLRMRADVRVGTCLSGGLDSSSVATVASEIYGHSAPQAFTAITAVSEDAATDESQYARRIADNSRLSWLTTKPTYAEFADTLPAIVRCQQEPFGGPSLTMQYFVMKTAREHGVKVLLDGQAGDETLFGYDRYYVLYLRHLLRERGWSAVIEGLLAMRKANQNMSVAGIVKYTLGGRLPSIRMLGHYRLQPAVHRSTSIPDHVLRFAEATGDAFRLQQLELSSTNLPVLLRYEDRNSMVHGIEARLPFLDYRLVDLSLNLPLDVKIRQGWTKWVLRKAMSDCMPPEITWRKNKFSFNAPDGIWLKRHKAEMMDAIARSSLVEAVTNARRLRKSMTTLSNGSLWRLYSVALWQREFGISA